MYYHCLSLRYVEYGTVLPHDDPTGWNRPAYAWLGRHCGYFPQIWLSRADIDMTGYRTSLSARINRGRLRRTKKDSILFGFDQIHGFPIEHEFWSLYVLNAGLRVDPNRPEDIDKELLVSLEWSLRDAMAERGENLDPEFDRWDILWKQVRPDLAEFLRTHVFIECGQYVVPSLNLKTAKRIICRNERQKKALREKGFIEDRIEIRNMPR